MAHHPYSSRYASRLLRERAVYLALELVLGGEADDVQAATWITSPLKRANCSIHSLDSKIPSALILVHHKPIMQLDDSLSVRGH